MLTLLVGGMRVAPTSSSSALFGAFDANIPTLRHTSFLGKFRAASLRLIISAVQRSNLQCLGGSNNTWKLA